MNTHLSVDDFSDPASRLRATNRVTWISVVVNLVLTILQVVVGILARSQALVADGLHSLSDLVADGVVLIAAKEAHKDADEDHPYGHYRFENAASLVLGALLLIVGVGMCWSAAQKLQDPEAIPKVSHWAFWTASATILAKEALFRYMLRVGEKLRSSMLIANAWHARSDAASSLVVAIGVAGNLMGYPLADALAAAMVGFMIARMGWSFGFDALSDLTDRSLDPDMVDAMRKTLAATPGVVGVHELRTRKMGDLALVDAHLLVSPTISVSEGHRIAEAARMALMAQYRTLDVLIHIDPEDDEVAAKSSHLPHRSQLMDEVHAATDGLVHPETPALIHYLDGQCEIDLFVDHRLSAEELLAVTTALDTLASNAPHLRDIRIHKRVA
ncbi:cation diffusion facilitator family transporter [Burkholderiaceae bacterium DAT-1]|nr:cation diffusion facilitator family transporter [Burkholderiaceae bacterium DAT-1]